MLSTMLVVLLGFVGLNAIAYMHAYRMTHFTPHSSKPRTQNPEQLSVSQKLNTLLTGVHVPKPINRMTPKSLGLSFQERWLHDGSFKIHVWRLANKSRKTAFLFHGYAGKKEDMLYEAKLLHRMGYNIVLIDFPGSGNSEGKSTTLGVREAQTVKAIVHHYTKKHPQQTYILVGFSMGAVAILRAVATYKLKPVFLVLSCPFDSLLSAVQNRFKLMGIPSFPSAQLLVFWGGVQHGFNGFRHVASTYAKHITTPTLLLQGDNDPRVTIPQSKLVFEALKSPKRMHVFKGYGHVSYAKVLPTKWQSLVQSFAQQATNPQTKRPMDRDK